ncbi:uncharacterized protein LOC133819214 isoform X2 [Humulus lupulus]|uniref:uncharacterized protein LOC133819214 isoform X2 n=1 Tax=Humulus lupulus TaxID=3486 RepID=UPI002B40094D|nr:uncharacterized protein LOC133819214 isoform X2 [Humulus lupulus]
MEDPPLISQCNLLSDGNCREGDGIDIVDLEENTCNNSCYFKNGEVVCGESSQLTGEECVVEGDRLPSHFVTLINLISASEQCRKGEFSNSEYQVMLHFKEEKKLVSKFGGSGFDCNTFDVEEREFQNLSCEESVKESVFLPSILNRSSWANLHDLNNEEKVLMEYVMDHTKPADEIVFLGEKVVGRRRDFLTLSKKQLVVNCLVEILSSTELGERGNKIRFCWIPTYLSRPDPLSCFSIIDGGKWRAWCGELADCEKVYAPILAKRHWFLAVFNLALKKVDVYDNFEIPSFHLGFCIINTMLRSMDNAFCESVKSVHTSDWAFADFDVAEPSSHHKKCADYDCGVYVMKMLLQEYVDGILGGRGDDVVADLDWRCTWAGPTNVPREIDRLLIGAKILTSGVNKVRDNMFQKAVKMHDRNEG